MAQNYKNNKDAKQDKYNAVWLSHSSVSDFLKCPRLYYLKNVWKNSNNRKVNLVSPHMSLGSAVHQTIEPLALIKLEERLGKFEKDMLGEFELVKIFESNWKKISGVIGGFEDSKQEEEFKQRGQNMIQNVIDNKGPIVNKTVKFYQGDFIPNIYLSEEENIILCGLVDWVEYIEKDDTLKVIDFKTGKNEEKEESFQLYIYKILVESLQKRKVSGGVYWYLDKDKFPTNKELLEEDTEDVKSKLLEVGRDIKKRKTLSKNIEDNFGCKYEGKDFQCWDCKEFELIKSFDDKLKLNRKEEENIQNTENNSVKYLGVGEYKQDLYFVKK